MGEGTEILTFALCSLHFTIFLSFFLCVAGLVYAQDKKLELMTISYASVSGTRAPLWIAKEINLYEK
jgi:hypothetical protein